MSSQTGASGHTGESLGWSLFALVNDPSTDHNDEGKYLQNAQTFDPEHTIDLHKYNVFDMLLSDGINADISADEHQMRIVKEPK